VLPDEIDRVPDSQLFEVIAELEAKRGGRVDCSLRCYMAAMELIVAMLGAAWARKHMLGIGKSSPYLRPKRGPGEKWDNQDRVTTLGDLLLNMQGVPGFAERLPGLRKGDVEAVVAELEGVKLALLRGLQVRFVSEIGRTGSDFDAEIDLGGRAIPCETECKLEVTGLSHRTIRRTLDKARQQLPEREVGAIFVKMPESWFRNARMETTVVGAVHEILRNTSRVGFVVFHWPITQELPGGAWARVSLPLASFRTLVCGR
jgi:hypothetical protein